MLNPTEPNEITEFSFDGEVELEDVRLLKKARDTRVEGSLTGRSVLDHAVRSELIGDINADETVLAYAKDCYIDGDVEAEDILLNTKRSSIYGDIKTYSRLMKGAKYSKIEGENIDAENTHILKEAENSYIKAREIIGKDIFERAKYSYIFADNVKSSTIGEKSEGSVLASKELEADNISSDITVFTESELEGTTRYTGDWEELESILGEKVEDGQFDTGIFNLKSCIEGIEDLENELSLLEDLEDTLYENPSSYKEVETELSDRLQISEDALKTVMESESRSFILDNLESISLRTNMKLHEFLETFTGDTEEYLLNSGFEAEYHHDPRNDEITTDFSRVRKQYFEEEAILLENLAENQGELDTSETDLKEEKKEELKKLDEKISDISGKPPDKLIEKRKKLKNELKYIDKAERERVFEDSPIKYHKNEDYRGISTDKLESALNYFKTILSDREKDKAQEILEGLSDPSDSIKLEEWDKELSYLPGPVEKYPCTLPGGPRESRLLEHMSDPYTQLIEIEYKDREGVAYTNIVEHEDEDYLFVHSLESEENLFNRKDVSEAAKKGLEEYAETADLKGIIYNLEPENTSPNMFLENLERIEGDFEEEEIYADKKGERVYLDIRFSKVNAYKKDIS